MFTLAHHPKTYCMLCEMPHSSRGDSGINFRCAVRNEKVYKKVNKKSKGKKKET